MYVYLFLCFFFTFLVLFLFFLASKSDNWDLNSSSGFECGFTSYFFSRFSFSVHYFLVALIFLFLDLELSFVFIFFLCYNSVNTLFFSASFFILALLLGLFLEWWELKLDWIY